MRASFARFPGNPGASTPRSGFTELGRPIRRAHSRWLSESRSLVYRRITATLLLKHEGGLLCHAPTGSPPYLEAHDAVPAGRATERIAFSRFFSHSRPGRFRP